MPRGRARRRAPAARRRTSSLRAVAAQDPKGRRAAGAVAPRGQSPYRHRSYASGPAPDCSTGAGAAQPVLVLRLRKVPLDLRPVDDVPPGFEVRGTLVLKLE